MKYSEEAKQLWKKYVPANGQADTIQGELMRSIEKLRWEAQNNGNINWDSEFEMLVNFIKETLLGEQSFSEPLKKEIIDDIKRILEFRHPYVKDDLYDRLTDRIVEWSKAHTEPVQHKHNNKLTR